MNEMRKGDTMTMGVTISTHNGSKVCREHNIRNEKVVSKESHIKPNGKYEIWHDEKLSVAYDRLFGKALAEYNAKQTRADRKIDNYLKHVRADESRHECYEMIVAIGNSKGEMVDEEKGRTALMKFVYGDENCPSWQQRNPNLEIVGCYYHADEEGVPHIHIDYVPVAHGYKKGLEVQNGLVKAFQEMGLEKKGKATAQIQWESRENAFLESLVNEIGYEVEHPKENREHIHTREYKQAQKQVEVFRQEADRLSINYEFTQNRLKSAQNSLRNTKDEILSLEKEKSEIKGEIDGIKAKSKILSEVEVKEVVVKPVPLQKDKVIIDKQEYDSLRSTAQLVDNVLEQLEVLSSERQEMLEKTQLECSSMMTQTEEYIKKVTQDKRREWDDLNASISKASDTLQSYQKDIRKIERREESVARRERLIDEFTGNDTSKPWLRKPKVAETLFKAWEWFEAMDEGKDKYSKAQDEVLNQFKSDLEYHVNDLIADYGLEMVEIQNRERQAQRNRQQEQDYR